MKSKQILRTLLIVTMLSSNIGCDQISKSIVRQRINYNEQIGLMNNYVTLTRIENTGAFLSLGNSLPQPNKSATSDYFAIMCTRTHTYLLADKT